MREIKFFQLTPSKRDNSRFDIHDNKARFEEKESTGIHEGAASLSSVNQPIKKRPTITRLSTTAVNP